MRKLTKAQLFRMALAGSILGASAVSLVLSYIGFTGPEIGKEAIGAVLGGAVATVIVKLLHLV